MNTVFDANLIVLIVALLIGLVIGWWMFRRMRSGATAQQDDAGRTAPPAAAATSSRAIEEERPLPTRLDTPEGNGFVDSTAAAASDVAGEILGVQAHAELPGAEGPPDNLQMLKGVGPKLAQILNANGITRFEHLARMTPDQVAAVEEKLGAFKGRLTRDRVVEQAAYLARGDRDGFQARFGNLGSAEGTAPLNG